MAADAISPFDTLSDEIFLKIITMAKGDNHDFLLDELCNVSVRFRQIATDSSLWRDFVRITVRLPRYEDFAAGRLDSMVTFNDDFAYFSKVKFMVRKCINDRTTRLQITGTIGPHSSCKFNFWSSLFPDCNDPLIDALINVAANFPKLKRVDLKRMGIQIESMFDIPMPWKLIEPTGPTRIVSQNSPWYISLVRWQPPPPPPPPPPSPAATD